MVVTTTDFARALIRGYIVLILGLVLVVVPVVGLVAALLVAPFLAGHEGARRLPESWATFYGLVAGTLWAVTLVGVVVLGLDFLSTGGVSLGSIEVGLLGPIAGAQVLLFWWGARSLHGIPITRPGRGRPRSPASSGDGLDLDGLGELRRRHGEIIEWGGGSTSRGHIPDPKTRSASVPPILQGPEPGQVPRPPLPSSTIPGQEKWVPVPGDPSIPNARVWTGPHPPWPLARPEHDQTGTMAAGTDGTPDTRGQGTPRGSRRRPLFKPRRAGSQPRSRSHAASGSVRPITLQTPATPPPDNSPVPRSFPGVQPGSAMDRPLSPGPGTSSSQGHYPPAGHPVGSPSPSTAAPGPYPGPTSPPVSEPTPSPSLSAAPRLSPLQELQRLKAQRASYVQGLAPRSDSSTIPGTSGPLARPPTVPSPGRAPEASRTTTSPARSSGGLSFTSSSSSRGNFDDLEIVAPSSEPELASTLQDKPPRAAQPSTSSPASPSSPSPPSSPSVLSPTPSTPQTPMTGSPASTQPETKPIGVMDMLGAVARGAMTGFSDAAAALTHDEEPKAGAKAPTTKADAKVAKDRSGSAIDSAVADVAAEAKKTRKAGK